METIHFSFYEKQKKKLALGIGKFDGLHLGHRAILGKILDESGRNSLIPAVFTFRNFPVEFKIYGWEEKKILLQQSGIELCIWCDFDEICSMKAEEFLDMISAMGTEIIAVGSNFHFGAERKGNISLLKKSMHEKGFRLFSVPPEKKNGEVVSSTKIRFFIKHGEMEKANDFLGRVFSVEGKVVQGIKKGTYLGFPTANLLLSNKVHISEGIYAGRVEYNGRLYSAAINIGDSPTFEEKEKKFEAFILDFNGDLYGKTLRVYLFKKIREIEKFSSEDELKKRISADIKQIHKTLAGL